MEQRKRVGLPAGSTIVILRYILLDKSGVLLLKYIGYNHIGPYDGWMFLPAAVLS